MPTGQALLDHMQQTPIIPNSLALYGLGQMGIAIKGPDGILYIDPCLSDVVRHMAGDWWMRAYDPPLVPEQVANASAILSTHEHADHLDPETLGPAAKASPNAPFIVTGWSREIMSDLDVADDRVIVPPAEQTIAIPGTSARLTALPSAHYTLEETADNGHRWFGYLIEWNGVVFYHSGDTLIYPGYEAMLRRHPKADVAMLPVNGRDWYREADAGALGNLWPAEAARLAKDMGWSALIVGHNDLYPNNTISFSSVADALERVAPRQAYKILQPGELYYYVKQ